MKPVITISIFLCCMTSVHAQYRVKFQKSTGIAASATIIEHSVRGYLEPFAAFSSNKKQFVLAPTLLVASNLGYKSPQSLRLTGTRIGYRFWPGTLDNKWEFYLSADMRVQRLKDMWEVNVYNQQSSEYLAYPVKTVELLIENYVGYGLVFNFNKSLSISQGVGLGWYFSDLHTNSGGTNSWTKDMVDYRGHDNTGLMWNVRFQVSYHF